jgi:hypothetical protein
MITSFSLAASELQRFNSMSCQVTITRTDTGANTRVKSDTGEANKDVASWSEALAEAERLGLINAVESLAAKALPPGFPLHVSADASVADLVRHGFALGKGAPPR